MSLETELSAYYAADSTLSAILTGGVYTWDGVGRLGLNDQTTPAMYNSNGTIKPAMLIRQLDENIEGSVNDGVTPIVSVAAVVQLWVYEDSGYTSIDAAIARLFTLSHGHILGARFPLEWAGVPFRRGRDFGALNGASVAQVNLSVDYVLGG